MYICCPHREGEGEGVPKNQTKKIPTFHLALKVGLPCSIIVCTLLTRSCLLIDYIVGQPEFSTNLKVDIDLLLSI